jgi:isopenicillin-N N-acyltransferase like protein
MPRTCEHDCVLSHSPGTLRGVKYTTDKIVVIEPGESHPRLPPVPEDVVLLSGEDRAKVLAERIRENYGRIDVPRLAEIIKRPVSMQSNLHDAIFAPESLEMWFADAGRFTPACDEPYARVNLAELLRFFAEHAKGAVRGP